MFMVLLGPPGAGKGTQAKRIEEQYNIPQISTGDIIRLAIQSKSEWGKKAEEYVRSGELVPDEVVIGIIRERLTQDTYRNGFMLDGFPRNLEQAEALNQLLKEIGIQLNLVLYFDVDRDEVIERLSARRICEKCQTPYNMVSKPPKNDEICDICQGRVVQRPDDRPEVIMNRLNTYEQQTKPLIDYYRSQSILKVVTSKGSIDDVFQQVQKVLESIKE
ncbi:adenylate kinase [Atribacter laminatus]|jgi:adenylate kinase|uniref:Adenylate kinase n=1 Tax=Atribacter laminatus TaxID=2847778 RepID=A0A7T1F4B2_ATRLM|nr:adenylate kinase [Atribacter laminatus]QPM69370.1 Adenylate kinase [Atribacter laminatus]